MKKKLLFLFVFSTILFFVDSDVFATMNYKNTELQCIYGNGVQVNMKYDRTINSKTDLDHISITLADYPTNSTVIYGDEITNPGLFDCDGGCVPQMQKENFNDLKTLRCPSNIKLWNAVIYERQADSSEWISKTKGVYAFRYTYSFLASDFGSSFNSYVTDYYKGTDGNGRFDGFGYNLWWKWYSNLNKMTHLTPINATNIVDKGNAYNKGYNWIAIPLVAERLYIVEDIGDDSYSPAFRVYRGDANKDGKEDDAQAVGANKYAQLYKGDGGSYYLHLGDAITSLSSDEAELFNNEYICLKESIASENASRGDGSQSFSSSRHIVESSSAKANCDEGFTKYVRTTKICKPQVTPSAGSFCDKYPNVAFVLIDIIQVLQVLIPALVIVLTGIEIGRIVVAGNIEEELPKRKQSMIIRGIVMVSFFFLPYITQLIISLAEGVSILEVNCLFGISKDPGELSEEDCEEAVKTEEE
ncbi:MAG: hypothetical protein IJO43_00330 [Bacilli bacterium]|nr:hypothetical protein [Bacilli bacterium]